MSLAGKITDVSKLENISKEVRIEILKRHLWDNDPFL